MRIVDNIAALRVHTNLTRTNKAIERNTLRLSSGFRINSAGDDPAGFAISLHLRNQIRTMNMADRNTWDGTSLLQTADAALQDIHNMLHRMRELAVQAANDTNSDWDRENIQSEIMQILEEINDITTKVEFNNIRLLNGETQNLRIQVGGRQGMSISINIPSFTTDALNLTSVPVFVDASGNPTLENTDNLYDNASGIFREILDDDGNHLHYAWDLEVTTLQHFYSGAFAQWAIASADAAIDQVSRYRANIGAFINRFEYTSSALRATVEATARSLSRIQDTDMAYEMMHLSTNNVMSQAAMAIMAQVNARPQQILQLI